jgi:hypothetical protein
VLVIGPGEQLLPEVLAAVDAQTRRPDVVVRVPRDRGLGAAVTAALADTPAQTGDGRGEWLWILHADAAPAPEALERLLVAVETAPSVAVAGCKQVEWGDEQRLLDVGITTSRLGAVITGLDRGELDQGQHDSRSDVLAVRTAGMLVRRDVWQQLGGPDPALTGARDDLELCRRVHLAGHRVVVVPGAVMTNAAETPYRDDRRDGLTLRLAWVRGPVLPFALLWSLLAGVVRAAVRLILKQPQLALDDMVAAGDLLARPLRWVRARRRIRRGRAVPLRALRPLGATGRSLLRQRRDELAAWIRPSARARAAALGSRHSMWRRLAVIGPVFALALTAGLIAGRRALASDGAVVGPYLPPVPDDAARLWHAATSAWRPVGLGSAAAGDPLGALLSVLSWPVGGDPGRLVALLLLAGPALAAVSAFTVAAALSPSRAVRLWSALVWAAAPPVLGAVLTGRPGAVVVHLTLPLLALALVRALARGSLTAASAAGLLLTVVVAAAPALAVPALAVLAVLAVLATAAGGWRRLLLAGYAAAVPAVLLLPWWTAVVRRPDLLAADPALGWREPLSSPWWHLAAVPQTADHLFAPPVWLVDRLGPAAAGLPLAAVPAVLVLTPVVVLAALALLRRRHAWLAALACWSVALIGLAAALVGERLVAGQGRVWPGPALSVAMLGLMGAATVVSAPLARRVRRLGPGRRRATSGVVLAGCVLGPALALGALALQGEQAVVHRADPDVLPAVATAEALGSGATRTLTLAVDGERVRWAVQREAGPRLGADSVDRRASAPDDAAVVVPVVSALLSDTAQDTRRALADLAVGSVLLLPPLDETAEQALDGAPGLVRVNASPGWAMWRVDPAPDNQASSRPARVRVVDAAGATRTVLPSRSGRPEVGADVPAGGAGRRVVLAERADPRWQARFDGVLLSPAAAVGGWSQSWSLPAHSGRLEIVLRSDPAWLDAPWVNGLRLAAAALAGLIALPLPNVRRRIGAPPAPRPTHPVERDPSTDRDPQPGPRVFDVDHPEDGELPPMFEDQS